MPGAPQAFSETAPAGTVVGTRPDAGAHVLSGKLVQLVVSKGPERFVVPTSAGKNYAQVQTGVRVDAGPADARRMPPIRPARCLPAR